jgi:hypothetical protein
LTLPPGRAALLRRLNCRENESHDVFVHSAARFVPLAGGEIGADVALPLPGWTPVVTNTFAPDGSYRYTNSSVTNTAAFYRLVSP